jgi:hypothetical protein
MGKAKHDWPRIKKDYVEGIPNDGGHDWPSLDDLAVKYGAGRSALRMQASKDGWTDLRRQYQTKVDQTRRTKRAEKLGSRQAEFDSRVMRVADTQLAMIVRKMNEMNAPGGDGAMPSVDPSVMIKLARALRDIQAVGRIALGIPSVGGPMGAAGSGGGVMRFEWVTDDPTDVDFD